MYKFDIMKFKFVGILAFCVGLVSFPSCDTDVEALEIQKLKHMMNNIMQIFARSSKVIMK